MDALLRALDRSHVLRRRTYAAGLALVGAAAVGGFFAAKAQQIEADPCQNGASIVETAWNPERRAAAERAIVAAGPAFAAEVWPRVDSELGAYTEQWVAQYSDACLAHRRGEQSDQMLDRRMSCLRQRKTALAEAAALLAERDVAIALHALELVGNLPDIERCGDTAVLLAEVPPPADPEVARKVTALREALVRVDALERAGRQDNAIDLADQLVREAEEIGDRPTLAEVLLTRGRLSLNLTVNPEQQAKPLQRALIEALSSKVDEVAAEAMARLVFVRGRTPGSEQRRALEDLELAEALVARLPAPDRMRGLLLNNAAVVYVSRGDAARARELLGQALQIKRAAYGPRDVEVAYTLTNLAMLAENPDERASGMRQVLDIFEAEFGSAHPQTIEARIATSLYTRDPEVARTLLRPGCDALARFTGDVVQRARCLEYFGHHSAEAGADESARLALRQAAELLAGDIDGDTRISVIDKTLIRAYAALDGGDHRGAIAELQETLKSLDGDEWWRRRERAELDLVLGLHRRALGDLAGAREVLHEAVEGFVAAAPFAHDILLEQRLARARVALAAALLAGPAPSPADLARAEGLLAEADRWYRGGGEAYAWRLSELRGLRDTLERVRGKAR